MTAQESINEIKKLIPFAEKSDLSVSKTNVAWQLDHSLKVMIGMSQLLKNSKPENFKPKFSFLKSFILFSGFIPRGKAKAPKEVNNRNKISVELLNEQVELLENLLLEVNVLPSNSYFTHPMFGDLDLKTSLKFMGIHTNHHIKIAKDIIK